MTSNSRAIRIDISRNLPVRAQPLSAGDLAHVFGGCLDEWMRCENSRQCCSDYCWRAGFDYGRRCTWAKGGG